MKKTSGHLGAGSFQVEDGDFFGTGKTIQAGQGCILFEQDWELKPIENQL